jgi:hypothetical protein
MKRAGYTRYEGPIQLSATSVLYAISKKNGEDSPELRAIFSKIPAGLNVVRYNRKYNPQYTARGDEGLIDGIRGSKTDFRTGDWQGFEGVNLDFVVDLGNSRKISSVSGRVYSGRECLDIFPEAHAGGSIRRRAAFHTGGRLCLQCIALGEGRYSIGFSGKSRRSEKVAMYV